MAILHNLKSICLAFATFVQQMQIRPISNNIQLLLVNVLLAIKWNSEHQYQIKHKLNRMLLKQKISLPSDYEEPLPVKDYCIWVLWWQGEEEMPPIVKRTYKSICDKSNVKVILITQHNWKSYITPDAWVVEKVMQQKMKLPALSDYIRASLLYEHGGMWIDSTVLCTKQIPEWIYNQKFFTIRNKSSKTNKYVANGRWNVQILGTNQRHLEIFRCLLHVFREYWKRYDTIMDYLLVDYSIDYAYNEKREVRKLIDTVPETNKNMHAILSLFDKPYSSDLMRQLEEGAWFFKLTYKHDFVEYAYNNRPTFYERIINK